MKAVFYRQRKQRLLVLVIAILWSAFHFSAPAWGIGPGVSMIIATDDQDQDPTYILGAAVKLEMIIKNDTNFPVNTERGFSKLEPHRFLVLIDPQGTHHVVGGVVTSGDAPPPFFLGEKTAIPAESLPAKWNKKITIEDLSKLFPVIKENIGWYKLQAHMPFVRLVWTLQHEQLGLLGIANDDRNFVGTVDSNQVQFHVVLAPDARGAHFRVRLLDQSTDPQTPINQAAVRVYEQSQVDGLGLEEIWAMGADSADLKGLSDTEGWTVWDEDLCKLQNDYTAIAFYQEEYKAVSFSKDQDTWAEQCEGNIEKIIYFGEEPPQEEIIVIKGGAYIYPEGGRYRASFSMDATNEGSSPTGWLKYYYTRTRLYLVSTEITEISSAGTNAVIKGTGTVNGVSGHSFEATVFDGQPDTFGINIKDSEGNIFYSTPSTQVSGGNLEIIVQ